MSAETQAAQAAAAGAHAVTGAAPFALDDAGTAWLVERGEVGVFVVERVDGVPAGARRYLGSVREGDVLFGHVPPAERALVAIAIGEAAVRGLPLAEVHARLAAGDAAARRWLDRWLAALALAAPEDSAAARADLVAGSGRLEVPAGRRLTEPPGADTWIRVAAGEAVWLGATPIPLTAGPLPYPLGRGMAIEARGPMTAEAAQALPAASLAGLAEALAGIGALAWAACATRAAEGRSASRARLEARVAQDAAVLGAAVEGLTSLTTAAERVVPATGEPLLAAARLVGGALGIDVKPPARSEDLARLAEPIDAIARASLFRTRRVLLEGAWWRQDLGPLLVKREADKAPLAALRQGAGYVLVDPAAGTRAVVDEALATTLEPFATAFYRTLRGQAADAATLARFALRGRMGDVAWVFGLGLLGSLLGMLTPHATGMLVDRAIPDADRGLLLQMGFALVASAVGGMIFNVSRGLVAQRIEGIAEAETQAAVWDRVLGLGAPFFRRYSVGDLTGRVQTIGQLRQQLGGATMSGLLSSLFALLNLGLMLSYSPQLSAVAVAVTLVSVAITATLTHLRRTANRGQMQAGSDLGGFVLQLIGGASKLQVAAAEGRAFARWAELYRRKQERSSSTTFYDNLLTLANDALPVVGTMAIFYVGVTYAGLLTPGAAGALATGTFLAFNSAFGTFQGGVTGLSQLVLQLVDASNQWRQVKPLLEEPAEVAEGKLDPGRLVGAIALEKVAFRYPNGTRLILDGVSLRAEPGEHIALVGPSGCGKSTILRLVLGFETPEAGIVTIDGQDLASLDMRAVRRQLGVVLQAGRVTAGTIHENIAAGAVLGQDEVWAAARAAGFERDVQNMPMGLHTIVAEGGANLSGGQRQRLLIARALALKPRVILFDEATSALDNETQAIVSQSLQALKVTRISIAHRLSTIRDADRIYVLEAGKVIQVGRFDELAAQPGLFRQFVERQKL